MSVENIVKMGLQDLHYALLQEGNTYDTPEPVNGAVNMSIEPLGDENSFYADNRTYYYVVANQGKSGELEVARINKKFETEVLGMSKDETSGLIYETTEDKAKECALMFRIEGDQHAAYYTLYGVKFSRPTTEASTISETQEPQTDTLTFTASGVKDLKTGKVIIQAHTTEDTPEDITNDYFSKVRMPGEPLSASILEVDARQIENDEEDN